MLPTRSVSDIGTAETWSASDHASPSRGVWLDDTQADDAPRSGKHWPSSTIIICWLIGLGVPFAMIAGDPLLSVVALAQLFWVPLIDPTSDGFATRDDEELLEDPEDKSVCLARVSIRQEGVLTGYDIGTIYVDSGFLVFSGRRCSFRIAGQDIAREASRARTDAGFRLRHPQRSVWVAVEPLRRGGDKDIGPRIRFMKEFRHWKEAGKACSDPSQYPPLAVSRSVRIEKPVTRRQALSTALVGLPSAILAIGLAWSGHLEMAVGPMVAGLIVSIIGVATAANPRRSTVNQRLIRIMRDEGQKERLDELGLRHAKV